MMYSRSSSAIHLAVGEASLFRAPRCQCAHSIAVAIRYSLVTLTSIDCN